MASTNEFSTAQLQDVYEDGMSDELKELLKELQIAEVQAAYLAKLFREHRYLRPELLWKKLMEQNLPEADLKLVAAYFSGYLAGDSMHSVFTQFVTGSRYSVMDGMEHTVGGSLVALLVAIGINGKTTIPYRGGTSTIVVLDALPESGMDGPVDAHSQNT